MSASRARPHLERPDDMLATDAPSLFYVIGLPVGLMLASFVIGWLLYKALERVQRS